MKSYEDFHSLRCAPRAQRDFKDSSRLYDAKFFRQIRPGRVRANEMKRMEEGEEVS